MAHSNVDEQDVYDTILPPVSSRAPPVHALPKWTKPNMGMNDYQMAFLQLSLVASSWMPNPSFIMSTIYRLLF